MMKRLSFLGSAAAVTLTACGGRGLSSVVPGAGGIAQSSSSRSAQSGGGVIGTPADPIPANVLAHPIIGEGRRFDGAVAPAGWLFLDGSTLKIAQYAALYDVLKSVGGGNGTTTFILPKPRQGWIVAASGTVASSPNVFANCGRGKSEQTAPPPLVHAPVLPVKQQQLAAQRSAALEAQRTLTASAPTPRNAPAVTTARVAAIDRADADARTAAFAALTPAHQASLTSLLSAAASGTTTVPSATARLSAQLEDAEIARALDAFDARQRTLGGAVIAHTDPRGEAARFLIEAGFSDAQLAQLRAAAN